MFNRALNTGTNCWHCRRIVIFLATTHHHIQAISLRFIKIAWVFPAAVFPYSGKKFRTCIVLFSFVTYLTIKAIWSAWDTSGVGYLHALPQIILRLILLDQGSPTWCPRACSKNNISMINVFTLTNINTKIIEGKLSKIFISDVCIKLVALRINR